MASANTCTSMWRGALDEALQQHALVAKGGAASRRAERSASWDGHGTFSDYEAAV